MKTKILGLAAVSICLMAAACAAPDTGDLQTSVPAESADIMAVVHDRAPAYPDVVLTDLSEGRFASCALIRVGDKRPHVIRARRENGQLRVATPYLFQAGSWDDERNYILSEHRAELCAKTGTPVPAF